MEEDVYKLNNTTLMSCTTPDDVVVRVESVNNNNNNNNNNVSANTTSSYAASASAHNELHLASNFLQLQPGSDFSGRVLKSQIANHPLYPDLVSAHIQCQKVGAPPELASLLEEISSESHPIGACCEIGDDPELDQFMESYCDVLHRYKEELSKPFNEATLFLCSIESQLNNLCKGTLIIPSDNNFSGGTSEEDELRREKVEKVVQVQEEAMEMRVGDEELKEMLLRKYSGYLSSLRKEFMKKRKKGKLPKDARMALMDWWNSHYRWPYPTEDEKVMLSEMSGLDQKQINNWFINQRKRHWKPSADMRIGIMEGINGAGILRPM